MQYRTLGKTNFEISEVSLGTWQVGGKWGGPFSHSNADEILTEFENLGKQWNAEETTMAEKTVIKDRLRYLNGRCDWISNEEQRKYVQQPIDELWQKILST